MGRNAQADGAHPAVAQLHQRLWGAPVDAVVVGVDHVAVHDRDARVDRVVVELDAPAAALDERLPEVALVVDAVAAEDGLGIVGRAGRVVDPEHTDVPALVGDGRQSVELGVRGVPLVGHEDRLRVGPLVQVGALRAADQPLAYGAAPVERVLHVHRVDLPDVVPAHEHRRPPAPVTRAGVDDGVVLVRRPVEAVGREEQVDRHAGVCVSPVLLNPLILLAGSLSWES